jgi:FAD/FMN-containing dehydrogenase
MRCIRRGEAGYDEARTISNARFDLYPEAICYCASAEDVRDALALAREEGLPIRIRSGGHHHEGMCSADGALIVDLSSIDGISFDGQGAWIGPGARLGKVYDAVQDAGRLFSGGGCGDVCVGGLVQGGGWGPYSRHLGLTCDRLIGFEMVNAQGEVMTVTEESDRDLLWAVRGGGGGNFGVLTGFRFALAPRPEHVLSFSLTWSDAGLVAPVLDEWRRAFPHDRVDGLTTFCRVTVVDRHADGGDPPVVIGGGFLGDEDELRGHLRRLLPTTFDSAELEVMDDMRRLTAMYQPGPPVAALRKLHPSMPMEDLKDTCAGLPHRHKVSSSFPNGAFLDGDEAVQRIVKFVAASEHEADARLYLSLHCMGGAIAAQDPASSAFAFRRKPFLLQYQAWWATTGDPHLGDRCIRWVRDFRREMEGFTEFAFINFPDRDLASDRKELLRYYYAQNLDRLIGIKGRVDPEDVFRFGMSIPTA